MVASVAFSACQVVVASVGCAGRGGGVGDRDDACGVTEAGPESGYKIWAFDEFRVTFL